MSKLSLRLGYYDFRFRLKLKIKIIILNFLIYALVLKFIRIQMK